MSPHRDDMGEQGLTADEKELISTRNRVTELERELEAARAEVAEAQAADECQIDGRPPCHGDGKTDADWCRACLLAKYRDARAERDAANARLGAYAVLAPDGERLEAWVSKLQASNAHLLDRLVGEAQRANAARLIAERDELRAECTRLSMAAANDQTRDDLAAAMAEALVFREALARYVASGRSNVGAAHAHACAVLADPKTDEWLAAKLQEAQALGEANARASMVMMLGAVETLADKAVATDEELTKALNAALDEARRAALEEAAKMFEADFKCRDHFPEEAITYVCGQGLRDAARIRALAQEGAPK